MHPCPSGANFTVMEFVEQRNLFDSHSGDDISTLRLNREIGNIPADHCRASYSRQKLATICHNYQNAKKFNNCLVENS